MDISGLVNLETIVVKKNALKNMNSIMICNNELLKTIEVEDDAFYNVKKVVIESSVL